MGFFEQILAIWNKTTLVQRALALAMVLACVITGTVLTKWASKPNFALLYQQVSPADAGKITDKLSELGVQYELRGNGTSIYVPDDKVHQLRLDIAKLGLPESGQGGYKIFDEQKIGTSPFVQGVNLNRALQDELAKSIQMIEGVIEARVHLVRPEQSLFGGQTVNTSASVVLRLSGGELSRSNIAAISHLVAGSVEGLKPENVTVVDSTGRLLSTPKQDGVSAGANTFLEYKERVESGLSNKVEAMLSTVLGHGRASVRVSAVIDMKSETLTTEKYDPQKVATKEEIISKSKAQPGQAAADKTAATPGNNEKEETTTTEYSVSKTVTQTTDAPGKITSMSVSAVVDLYPDTTAKSEGAADASKAGGELIMSVDQVKALIKNALGLKDNVDTIEVVNTKFYRPAEPAPQKAAEWPKYLAMAKQASLGIMAVCALIVLKMFGGSKSAAGAPQLAAGTEGAQQLMTGSGQQMLPGPGMMRDQILVALQQNPDHVRRMFTNWVQEKQE
jgi:flagellar M-ring protein FliF